MGDSPLYRVISARHWRRCSSLLVLAASACTPAPAVAPTPSDVAWRARLLRIEDTRRDEPVFVDSLLTGAEPRARAFAAIAVGRVGARAHLPVLRRLAVDPDSGVAASALFALGLLKDSASASLADSTLRAVPTVPTVAAEAAWLLGELGERGRPAIVAALHDNALGAPARGSLLLAATRLRPVPAEAIIPWVSSADTAVAWRAAYALARGRSAAGVRALLGVKASASDAVREQVARGLTRALAGDSLAMPARAALVALLSDTSARVRILATRSLATYGADGSAPVLAALRDADAGVRLTAAQSLRLISDGSAKLWLDAFAADTAFVIQRAIAAGDAKVGVTLPDIAGWRTSPEWQRRAAVAELDGRGNPLAAIDRLEPWLRDSDGRVRAAAAGALAALADSAAVRPQARAMLRRLLSDADVVVRSAALGGLAGGATTDDLALALDAYRLSRTDTDNDARLAFWQLADTALKRSSGVVPDRIGLRLDALPRPSDPLERMAAARIPRFAAWSDSTGTARPIEWYQARAGEAHRSPVARIETDRGILELALFAEDAPLTVYNFTSLARRGYFDGQRFHRVVPNFVVQGGDPRGDGNGGPGYAIGDELNRHRYLRGTLGMALSGPNTGGSQFFVTHSPQPHLDGGYTVFGQLLSGGNVLDRIVQGDRIVRITIQ
jgi:cyclophilin family peptidyl-prolyl cis-trans isomerase/HEAT repeat protein